MKGSRKRDLAESRFFTDETAAAIGFKYDGTNMTWKGYINNLSYQVNKMTNAVILYHPCSAVKPLVRAAKFFDLLNQFLTLKRDGYRVYHSSMER